MAEGMPNCLCMWVTNNSNNYGFWSNADYDAIIKNCISGPLAVDATARWQALKDAEKIVMTPVGIGLMRVIPIEKAIDGESRRATYEELSKHIEEHAIGGCE